MKLQSNYLRLNMLTGIKIIPLRDKIRTVFRLMTWINSLLEDETIFPSKIGVQFPPNFRDIAHRIMRRLFRIYAHIYCRHLQEQV